MKYFREGILGLSSKDAYRNRLAPLLLPLALGACEPESESELKTVLLEIGVTSSERWRSLPICFVNQAYGDDCEPEFKEGVILEEDCPQDRKWDDEDNDDCQPQDMWIYHLPARPGEGAENIVWAEDIPEGSVLVWDAADCLPIESGRELKIYFEADASACVDPEGCKKGEEAVIKLTRLSLFHLVPQGWVSRPECRLSG